MNLILVIIISLIKLPYLAKSLLGEPYTLINKVQTQCELLSLNVGTMLADSFNNFDENTERDQRLHHNYLSQYLGFATWMRSGYWNSGGLTADNSSSNSLNVLGGWSSSQNISNSSFWAFEDQWIYMMGDSTMRQIWGTFVSPFQVNGFERNTKEWTREHVCIRYLLISNFPFLFM